MALKCPPHPAVNNEKCAKPKLHFVGKCGVVCVGFLFFPSEFDASPAYFGLLTGTLLLKCPSNRSFSISRDGGPICGVHGAPWRPTGFGFGGPEVCAPSAQFLHRTWRRKSGVRSVIEVIPAPPRVSASLPRFNGQDGEIRFSWGFVAAATLETAPEQVSDALTCLRHPLQVT